MKAAKLVKFVLRRHEHLLQKYFYRAVNLAGNTLDFLNALDFILSALSVDQSQLFHYLI